MTDFATLTSKNQLTLPVELVTYAQLQAGDRMSVDLQGKKIILEEVPTLADIRNRLANDPRVVAVNTKYTSDEVVKMARKMKPPKGVYDY